MVNSKGFRIILITTLISMVICTVGCNVKKNQNNVDYKKYTDIVIAKEENDKFKIYGVSDKKLNYIEERDKFLTLNYSESGINVYNILKGSGNNLVNTYLKINDKKEQIIIKDDFYYKKVILNPSGNNIAYISYAEDDFSTAKTISIYNLRNKKIDTIPANITISGDNFLWVSDEELIIYNVTSQNNIYGEVLSYNINTKEVKSIYSPSEGYITFLANMGNSILMLESGEKTAFLTIFDLESKNKTVISKKISNVYSSKSSKDGNYAYIIGKNEDNKNYLFQVDVKNRSVLRINYDFPRQVNKEAGIAIDEKNNVYFVGGEEVNNIEDVYVYNSFNKDISLISEKSSYYKIF